MPKMKSERRVTTSRYLPTYHTLFDLFPSRRQSKNPFDEPDFNKDIRMCETRYEEVTIPSPKVRKHATTATTGVKRLSFPSTCSPRHHHFEIEDPNPTVEPERRGTVKVSCNKSFLRRKPKTDASCSDRCDRQRAERFKKSKLFNQLKVGDKVKIGDNGAKAKHNITNHNSDLLGSTATVVACPTWPSTWLTATTDDGKTTFKVRTSQITRLQREESTDTSQRVNSKKFKKCNLYRPKSGTEYHSSKAVQSQSSSNSCSLSQGSLWPQEDANNDICTQSNIPSSKSLICVQVDGETMQQLNVYEHMTIHTDCEMHDGIPMQESTQKQRMQTFTPDSLQSDDSSSLSFAILEAFFHENCLDPDASQTLALLQYSRRNIIPGLLTMLHMEKALELDNKQDYLHVFDGKSLLRVGANLEQSVYKTMKAFIHDIRRLFQRTWLLHLHPEDKWRAEVAESWFDGQLLVASQTASVNQIPQQQTESIHCQGSSYTNIDFPVPTDTHAFVEEHCITPSIPPSCNTCEERQLLQDLIVDIRAVCTSYDA